MSDLPPGSGTSADGSEPAVDLRKTSSEGTMSAPDPTPSGDAASSAANPASSPTGTVGESRRQRRRRERAARPKRKAPWWELPALIVLAIGIAILVKSFVIQPFFIPSDSMEKTLHGCTGCSGDRILVNKLIYDFRDPHPGDIVVFHDPPDWASDEPASHPPGNPVVRAVRGFGQLVGFVPPDGEILVKRVIAVGGQTVKGNGQGVVSISDHGAAGPWRTLNEPFVYAPRSEWIDGKIPGDPFGPVTVPKGRLWVMGDHQTDSADSRYHCSAGGQGLSTGSGCNPRSSTVPVSDVIGKAFVIAWPPSRWRTLGTPSTFDHDSAASGALALAAVVPIGFVRRRRRRRK